MTSLRPVLGCVRSTLGLGFLHTCLMGIYVGMYSLRQGEIALMLTNIGAPTYLVSPVDFAQNPMSLFLTLARYKIKDTYATSQMLDYAMSVMPAKGFQLQELKNLMINADGRPRADICKSIPSRNGVPTDNWAQTRKYDSTLRRLAWIGQQSTLYIPTCLTLWSLQDHTCASSQ